VSSQYNLVWLYFRDGYLLKRLKRSTNMSMYTTSLVFLFFSLFFIYFYFYYFFIYFHLIVVATIWTILLLKLSMSSFHFRKKQLIKPTCICLDQYTRYDRIMKRGNHLQLIFNFTKHLTWYILLLVFFLDRIKIQTVFITPLGNGIYSILVFIFIIITSPALKQLVLH